MVRHCNSSACAACVAYLSDISCTRSVRPGWSSTELLEFLKVSFISSFLRSISHCLMTILWIWKIFLPDAGPGPSCLDNGLPCQSPRGAQVDWALRIHRWGGEPCTWNRLVSSDQTWHFYKCGFVLQDSFFIRSIVLLVFFNTSNTHTTDTTQPPTITNNCLKDPMLQIDCH